MCRPMQHLLGTGVRQCLCRLPLDPRLLPLMLGFIRCYWGLFATQ